jgi:pimeloyl-ACP methyl ester carboxylesterase
MTARPLPRRRWIPVTLVVAVVLGGGLAACSDSPTGDPVAGSSSTASSSATAPASDSTLRMISNDGHRLAFHVVPGHLPAIVLDAGGGADSSYWKDVVPKLSQATGSEIITYDRAGLGDSDEVPGSWDVHAAVSDLQAGLRQLGVTHDVVLVSHSQAGEVATYFALANPTWVSGAVLVDASLPPFYTDEEIARIVAVNTPQIEQLKNQPSTKQTRQVIATAANYGPVHHAYHEALWPKNVPAIVMVSEKTPFDGSPEDAQRWRDAAAAFASAGPGRELVTAQGSSHDIPLDKPELVLDQIEKMVARG